MRKFMTLWLLGIASASPVSAHHSYVMFGDAEKEISGTIVRLTWANPHVWVYVKADEPGNPEWALELGGVNSMSRQGVRSSDLQPGGKLVATIRPNRDGRMAAKFVRGTTATGRQIGSTPTPKSGS